MRIVLAVLLLCPLVQCQLSASSALNPAALKVRFGSANLKQLNATATGFVEADASAGVAAAAPTAGPLRPVGATPPAIILSPKPKHLILTSQLDSRATRNWQIWYSLIVIQHGAAAFDGWTTREAIGRGAVELNPMMKPFAHSAAIYPALQLWPTGMDYIGMRMMRSNRPVYRKLWWVPQAASATASIVFGIRNMGVQSR